MMDAIAIFFFLLFSANRSPPLSGIKNVLGGIRTPLFEKVLIFFFFSLPLPIDYGLSFTLRDDGFARFHFCGLSPPFSYLKALWDYSFFFLRNGVLIVVVRFRIPPPCSLIWKRLLCGYSLVKSVPRGRDGRPLPFTRAIFFVPILGPGAQTRRRFSP